MSGAPAWVPYTSVGIAALSLLMSAIALAYTQRTFRRAGVSVEVWASWERLANRDLRLNVMVTSLGLSEVTIQSIGVAVRAPSMSSTFIIARLPNASPTYGPELPYRLRDGHTESWWFRLSPIVDLQAMQRRFRRGRALERHINIRYTGLAISLALSPLYYFMGLPRLAV